MQFLADVRLTCPECGGRRFVGPVLDVQPAGKSVADVLAADRRRGARALRARPRPRAHARAAARRSASAICGSASRSTRSAAAKRSGSSSPRRSPRPSAAALIVLDEPTAGLHADDVAPLLALLRSRSSTRGGTVVVVEHDMRVAARADHVIDLGPGAGEQGGRIVAQGTPEQVARKRRRAARRYLARRARRRGASLSERAGDLRPSALLRAQARVIRVRGAREHNLQRRRRRDPARAARRGHRPERQRQEHARVRRHLRRGAAPLPRDALAVRAPVPAAAAAARRRPRRRACRRRVARAAHARAAARTPPSPR